MRHLYHYLWSRHRLTVINRPIPGDQSHALIASPWVSQIRDNRKTKRPALWAGLLVFYMLVGLTCRQESVFLVQVVGLVCTLYEHTRDARTLIISSRREIDPAILLTTFVAGDTCLTQSAKQRHTSGPGHHLPLLDAETANH